MRRILPAFFLLFSVQAFTQVRDLETKVYDLFVFNSGKFLTGQQDGRYHPAQKLFPFSRRVEVSANYHDLYREWGRENEISFSQSTAGMKADIPFGRGQTFFSSSVSGYMHRNVSSYSGKHNEVELSDNLRDGYTVQGDIAMKGDRDKTGVRVQYSDGTGNIFMNVRQYPTSTSSSTANSYFYDLLEPAFGKTMSFNLSGGEVDYSLEYIRLLSSYFSLGINYYQEIDNYHTGIDYYSRVEQIAGPKKLDGTLHRNRYTLGLTGEYTLADITVRSSVGYSVPYNRLRLEQNTSVQENNVNLEIFHLSSGEMKGEGVCFGAGLMYRFAEDIKAGLSYRFFRNRYSGYLDASTPVLGYELLPIAHQLDAGFTDAMKNHILTFVFNHYVSYFWLYSCEIEYMYSDNTIHDRYDIMAEFGIGSSKEDGMEHIVLHIFKLDLSTVMNVTTNVGIRLSYNQYIPIVKNLTPKVDMGGPPSPGGEQTTTHKKTWGGTLVGLSLIYQVH